MFKTIAIPLAVVCLATAALAQPASGPPLVRAQRWTVDQGLKNNALTHVIQTRDGYLWVASWAGVVRFDGVRFTSIADALPNVHVHWIYEDRDGAVWLATGGGGLVRWTPDGQTIYTEKDGLAGNAVSRVIRDGAGALWIVSEAGGLTRMVNGTFTAWRTKDGYFTEGIIGLFTGANGQIVIGTSRSVCDMQGDTPVCRPHRSFPAPPQTFHRDRSGHEWMSTLGGGIFNIDRDGASSPQPCAKGCLAGHETTSIADASDGGLWIGLGKGGGVAHLKDGVSTVFTPESHGLPAFPVSSLFEDAEGSVWIASDIGGLAQLRRSRVTVYSTPEGMPAPAAASIAEDSNGTIWAGSRCGPIASLHRGRFEARFAEQFKNACALSAIVTRGGELWVGTEGAGLFRSHGDRLERVQGIAETFVPALFEDSRGLIWIATASRIYRYDHGALSGPFGAQDGLPQGAFVTFAEAPDGRIWIGSNAYGLYLYEQGRFRAANHVTLPTGHVAALMVDRAGDLWIGTADRGLLRVRGDRVDVFGAEQGLGDNLVALMIEDRQSNIWVSTTKAILRLERSRIEAVANGAAPSLDPIVIDKNDGLRETEGMGGGFDPSGLRTRDGKLWFSTIDGVALIDPDALRINTVAPPVVIEQTSVNGKAPSLDNGAIVVPPGSESIEFVYTALSLVVPHRVRFRYRLAGAESAWHEAGTRRTAMYNQLRPGGYTFEVTAANNDGVWSSRPAAIRLVVLPLFWERRGVQAGAVGLLLVVTAVIANIVAKRRMRRRVAELEREQALTRERTRIARDLHDDLGARLAQIALVAEAGTHGDSLDRISSAAREAMQTMDELVWSVNARNDTTDSFAEYVAEFAEEHLSLAGIRVRLQIQPDLGDRELLADARRNMFLAVKECIHNIVKHSGATEVRVAIACEDHVLAAEVVDNGKGIPEVLRSGTGNGLRNMRERMESIGGSYAVESRPGQTRMVFTTPLT